MSMKTPPQWNISSRVIILIFITQEFLFLSDGVRVSGAQLMVSPAPLADIAVDDLTECAFPLDTFQNRTTSLPISCSLEGGRIWFTLRLKNSGQMYYNFLGSKAWHRREKCPRNKQVDSKQMLEGRPKFQESSWMKEVWNNKWYNSMLLHIRHNWDVFCLPKISNQCASLVHTIKTFSSSWTQASDHLQGDHLFATSKRSCCWTSWPHVYKDSLCIPASDTTEHWSWSQTPVPCARGSLHRHVPILKAETKPKPSFSLPELTTPSQPSWLLQSEILGAILIPLPGKNSSVESITPRAPIQEEKQLMFSFSPTNELPATLKRAIVEPLHYKRC